MKVFKKNAVFFASGGAGYGALELLWRGRTHWSMLIAGGLCFMLFSRVAETCKGRSRFYQAALCAVGVTAVEFVFGVIFNIILKKNVWDYSAHPLNVMGQICPLFTVLWGVLGFLLLPVVDKLNRILQK